MKVKCNYCDNMFNDTNEKCPHCGAPNEAVVRTVSKQPLTIGQLQKWYKDRGLPPYETTRFFIGIDYKKPRAFGIYKDEKGKCVVYKNKDNGTRAIRYEGTDEAYAVNELYQRLKQEILEQKAINTAKTTTIQSRKPDTFCLPEKKKRNWLIILLKIVFLPEYLLIKLIGLLWEIGPVGWFLDIFVGSVFLTIALLYTIPFFLLALYIKDPPNQGYYVYRNEPYFCFQGNKWLFKREWMPYDEEHNVWYEEPIADGDVPEEFKTNKSASAYFVSEDWNESLKLADFCKTDYYYDVRYEKKVSQGYYQYEGITYYHLESDPDSNWYVYNDEQQDWSHISSLNVPEALHETRANEDFYYTPTWDSSTQISDFTSSTAYRVYQDSQSKSTYSSSSDDTNWDNDDDNHSYDWDSSSSWSSGSTDWDSDW